MKENPPASKTRRGIPDNYRVLRNELVTTVAVTVAMTTVSATITVRLRDEDVHRVGVETVRGSAGKASGANLRSHDHGGER
jgi:hypothetical protein